MTIFVLFAVLLAPVVAFTYAGASPQSDVCTGIGGSTSGTTCTASGGSPSVQNIITTIVNVFSYIIGIVAVIMVMVAGFKYITSNGDSGAISSAKNTLIYAIVGLAIVALAQFIVNYVLSSFS